MVERACVKDVAKANAYLADSDARVRRIAVDLLAYFGRSARNLEVRDLAHDAIIEVATQTEDSHSAAFAADLAMNPYNRWELTPSQAKRVVDAVRTLNAPSELVLLAGLAHGAEVADRLREGSRPLFDGTYDVSTFPQPPAVVQVLARQGDTAAIAVVLKIANTQKDEDIKYVLVAQTLGYVRQPETVRLLLEQLFSETTWSLDGRMKEHAAWYAMEPLLEALDNVPDSIVQLNGPRDVEKRLASLRTWVLSQKEFIIRGTKKTFTWHPPTTR
jgi:hypothetical protein